MVPPYYVLWALFVPLAVLQLLSCLLALLGLVLSWRRSGVVLRHAWYLYEIPLMMVFWKFVADGPVEPSSQTLCVVYWTLQVSCIGLVVFPWVAERDALANVFLRRRRWRLGTRIVVLLIATAGSCIVCFMLVSKLLGIQHWIANQ